MSKGKDVLFNLKYMGYCMANLPPDNNKISFFNFINYVKFQLCQDRGILMKDSIWDKYADEEILVEYFAVLYTNDKTESDNFLAQTTGEDSNLCGWFDKMQKDNKKEIDKLLKEKDSITFNPSDVTGD